MTVKDWLAKSVKTHTYYDGTYEVQENRPRLYCNDGYSISVQASEFHYCSPRINEFADGGFDYTDTVYGYVPIEIVEKLIEKHGGIRT